MNQSRTEPSVTDMGVAFTVRVDSINRDCVVSNEALAKLAKAKGEIDPLEVYRVFEANINGVARRLVAANVPGTPLLVGEQFFR